MTGYAHEQEYGFPSSSCCLKDQRQACLGSTWCCIQRMLKRNGSEGFVKELCGFSWSNYGFVKKKMVWTFMFCWPREDQWSYWLFWQAVFERQAQTWWIQSRQKKRQNLHPAWNKWLENSNCNSFHQLCVAAVVFAFPHHDFRFYKKIL